MKGPLRRNGMLAFTALVTTSGTLVCCVFPAVMVSLGAGATLAGIVSACPQLVWLSEHKALVFTVATGALAIAGVAIWRGRTLACPADPEAALACLRLRRFSASVYALAVLAFCVGLLFALLPLVFPAG